MSGGKRVGKTHENAVYLNDLKADTAYREEISTLLDNLQRRGVISAEQREEYMSAYEDIDSTDGQAFRTLRSMRDVKIMSGEWSEEFEDAYNRIMGGHATTVEERHFGKEQYDEAVAHQKKKHKGNSRDSQRWHG